MGREIANKIETKIRKRGNPSWSKGKSGNPDGRPKLPEEVRAIKKMALEQVIKVFASKVLDPEFATKELNQNTMRVIETVFDRFGLPKVTKEILAGDKDEPVVYKWQE